MKFIRQFLTAWQDARFLQRYDELADHPDYWTEGDQEWLANALAAPSGQKWMRRLNNVVIRGAIDATRRTLNPRYQCGVARGMALMKASIDRDYTMALALASAKSGNTEATDDEIDSADLERLLSQ